MRRTRSLGEMEEWIGSRIRCIHSRGIEKDTMNREYLGAGRQLSGAAQLLCISEPMLDPQLEATPSTALEHY